MKQFEELRGMLHMAEQAPRLGVVAAQDRHTLEAVAAAAGEGIVTPVLYGRGREIAPLWEQLAPALPLPELVEAQTVEQCISAALSGVRDGTLACIMKGALETGTLMKAVVHREHGIRRSPVLSLIAMIQPPSYHKLFAISDVGLNTYPGLEQKRAILENAVALFHALGTPNPKVAVLAALEKVNPKMPETVDAAALKELNRRGEVGGCTVEGPISYDLCMDREAAAIKGYQSPVAGDPDILIVPDINAGNVLAKSLTCSGGARTCGTVTGAQVPIVLTSRSATAEDKFYSILLSAVAGQRTGKEA